MVKKNLKYIIILFILSYFFLMLGNGLLSLTSPDEVFYAQTAKEMIQHNSWLTPYLFGQPQFEKPIFLYWLLRVAFGLFGISSFAARLFPAVFACFGVIAVYFLSLIGLKNEKKAFISSLIILSSGLYIGMARTLFTDLIFSIFILFALLAFYGGYSDKNKKGKGLVLFFIFSALAVLTKGPLGLFIPILIILLFLFIRKDSAFLFNKYSLWGFIAFALISFPWFVYMMIKYSPDFSREFFYNDHVRRFLVAEHPSNDRWYFYPLSVIGTMFPWSLFTLAALISAFKNIRQRKESFYTFLISWIVIVFIVFQFAHSKLVSYILPLFPALAVITGDFIYNAIESQNKKRLLFGISLACAIILFIMPLALIGIFLRYSFYLSWKLPFYFLIFLLFGFSILFSSLIFRHKFSKAVFVLGLMLPTLVVTCLCMHNDLDQYVSSKPISEYLLKNYTVDGPIICSKAFVRGVRYYTDKEVICIGFPKPQFFSPHPITMIGSDQEIYDYLKRHSGVYFILNKKLTEELEHALSKQYKMSVLKIIGNQYLLRIEHEKAG